MKQSWMVGPVALCFTACAAPATLSAQPPATLSAQPPATLPAQPPATLSAQPPATLSAQPPAPMSAPPPDAGGKISAIVLAPSTSSVEQQAPLVPQAAIPPTFNLPLVDGRGLIDASLIVITNESGTVTVTGRPHAVTGNVHSVTITAFHRVVDDMASALAGRAGQDIILGSIVQSLEPDGSFTRGVVQGRTGAIAHGEQVVISPQGATEPNIGPAVTLLIP
jgi:hypothetical protein